MRSGPTRAPHAQPSAPSRDTRERSQAPPAGFNASTEVDPSDVLPLSKHLLRALADYLRPPHRSLRFLEILLAVESFHATVVASHVRHLGLNADEAQQFYAMVIRTLDNALQQEWERRFTAPGHPPGN